MIQKHLKYKSILSIYNILILFLSQRHVIKIHIYYATINYIKSENNTNLTYALLNLKN